MPERFSLWRTLLIGGFLCCVVPLMAHTSIDIVHASYMAIDQMPVAAIFLFFVLVFGVNTVVRAVRKEWALTRPELLVVYAMLLMACSLTTMGLGAQLLPITGAPFYYATAENRWIELIQPHVPAWLNPGMDAIKGFFVGMDKGGSIPWGAWIVPVASWLVFLIPAYFVMIALIVMLRKQWVEREHLIFPLTALPLAMSEDPDDGRLLAPIFRNPGMWVGFGVVFVIMSLTALHSYWDAFPTIALSKQLSIFRNTTTFYIRLSFPVLGLAFLINKDLAFSLWFVNLIFLCITGTFNVMGVRLDENLGIYGAYGKPIFSYLGMGAMAAFVIGGLYNAREHLGDVFGKAFGRRREVDDSGEILPYRTAVWGGIISLIVMWAWLSLAGLPPLMGPLYLVLVYIIFLGLARVVSEGGLPTIVAAMIAPTAVISMMGSDNVGAGGLVVLGLMYAWCADIRIFPMSQCAQGLKLVESFPGRRRKIFGAIALALAVSFVVSIGFSMYLAYTRGGITLNSWFFVGGPKAPYQLVADKMQNPSSPSIPGFLLMGLGAGITVFLSVMRASFAWFSLHPIGFVVGGVWLLDALWFSIFLAWLIKALVLRYGGPSVYRKAVPFFLGLILGTYTSAAFWFVVDLITGKTDNQVFWI